MRQPRILRWEKVYLWRQNDIIAQKCQLNRGQARQAYVEAGYGHRLLHHLIMIIGSLKLLSNHSGFDTIRRADIAQSVLRLPTEENRILLRARFCTFRLALGTTRPPIQRSLGLFPGAKAAGERRWHHPIYRTGSRKRRAIPLLPPPQAFAACSRVSITFLHYHQVWHSNTVTNSHIMFIR